MVLSGKSSLLSSILRILDASSGVSSGRILIDGLDLSTIPRSLIRSRLATVPQKPVSLPGTVRLNVDPFARRSDEEIIAVLNKVHLWSVLADRGGLEAEYAQVSLSQGQEQL
jgi:ATP-binding cassette subfamily C (CFTR/MRP) protein 1